MEKKDSLWLYPAKCVVSIPYSPPTNTKARWIVCKSIKEKNMKVKAKLTKKPVKTATKRKATVTKAKKTKNVSTPKKKAVQTKRPAKNTGTKTIVIKIDKSLLR